MSRGRRSPPLRRSKNAGTATLEGGGKEGRAEGEARILQYNTISIYSHKKIHNNIIYSPGGGGRTEEEDSWYRNVVDGGGVEASSWDISRILVLTLAWHQRMEGGRRDVDGCWRKREQEQDLFKDNIAKFRG